MQKKPSSLKALCLCSLFTALLTVGAYLKLPLSVIPLTLQTLFVLLAGMLLGSVYAPSSCLCYLFLGLIGLPVFAQGGGVGYLLTPSCGYLLGFAPGAWVTARLSPASSSFSRLLLAALAGLGVIYLFGSVYYYLLSTWYFQKIVAVRTLLTTCVFVPLPVDCVSAVLAASLAKRLRSLPIT